jgi:hypothetical protein
MRRFRTALLVAVACATLLLPSCKTGVTTDTFDNGTYTGTFGQVLVINGDDFSYTLGGAAFAGNYTIDGSAVTFNTTKFNGNSTGLNQRTTFDFTKTPNSITLTNMRDLESGGCGMSEGTFMK